MNNHRHRFNDIDGKCDFCNILGCKYGLIDHRFNLMTLTENVITVIF